MSLRDRLATLRARAEILAERAGPAASRMADRFDAFADRRFGFVDRDDRIPLLVALLLLGHVLVWTLQPILSHENLADSVDMVENWVWGKEWQWGYWKHPPFFAWVTAAWFSVFPRADWAYYLLSATNAAVGLAGIWAMTGVVDRSPRRRFLALVGLNITPIWGFLALKFNANAILLAVWPWAAWAFLRALKSRSARDGALLGAMLALAMLSKYVSVVLILGMIAVVLTERDRWALVRSPAALAALGVGTALFLPHLVWIVATEFRTFAYAEHQQATSTWQFVNYLVRLPLSMALFLAPMIAVQVLARPEDERRDLWRLVSWHRSDADRRRVLVLFAGSFAAIVALGTIEWVRLSSQWGFPLMFAAGWLFASIPDLDTRRLRMDRAAAAVALVWAGLIVTAPLVDAIGVATHRRVHIAPAAELGREATRIWREEANGARLAVVAGTFDVSHQISFYSPDAPSVLIEWNWANSPWLTPEGVTRTGVLVVCALDDAPCAENAKTFFGPDLLAREATVAKRWWGLTLPASTVRLFLRLPAAAS